MDHMLINMHTFWLTYHCLGPVMVHRIRTPNTCYTIFYYFLFGQLVFYKRIPQGHHTYHPPNQPVIHLKCHSDPWVYICERVHVCASTCVYLHACKCVCMSTCTTALIIRGLKEPPLCQWIAHSCGPLVALAASALSSCVRLSDLLIWSICKCSWSGGPFDMPQTAAVAAAPKESFI